MNLLLIETDGDETVKASYERRVVSRQVDGVLAVDGRNLPADARQQQPDVAALRRRACPRGAHAPQSHSKGGLETTHDQEHALTRYWSRSREGRSPARPAKAIVAKGDTTFCL